MNILEHYIEEIISVEKYNEDWTKDFDDNFVLVHLTANCYGNVSKYTKVFNTNEWEKIKELGYFMA